jgi:hypothetical protein
MSWGEKTALEVNRHFGWFSALEDKARYLKACILSPVVLGHVEHGLYSFGFINIYSPFTPSVKVAASGVTTSRAEGETGSGGCMRRDERAVRKQKMPGQEFSARVCGEIRPSPEAVLRD